MNVKLLLDENLSPRVAEILRNEDGLDAVHIRDRGLLEATDHEVLERAYTEDRVLATENVDDFVKLARARELHPGIILVEDGDLVREEQLRVLRAAVAALQSERDLWGAERIRGELLRLGIRVAKRTIQRYMRTLRRRPPGGQRWATRESIKAFSPGSARNRKGVVLAFPIRGGLHHDYRRAA